MFAITDCSVVDSMIIQYMVWIGMKQMLLLLKLGAHFSGANSAPKSVGTINHWEKSFIQAWENILQKCMLENQRQCKQLFC